MVDYVINLLETQHRLVRAGRILTVVVVSGFTLPKIFVDDAPHNLTFGQVMGMVGRSAQSP